MERIQFTACALLLAQVNFNLVSAYLPPPGDKRGICPSVEWFGVSGNCHLIRFDNYCKNDFHCPGNEKCCFNGCGSVCADPFVGEKPGVCPPFRHVNGSYCAARTQVVCENDFECFGNAKCCLNECGRTCLPPWTGPGKPGRCPPRIWHDPSRCPYIHRKRCFNDNECIGRRKCCDDGCGPVCLDPFAVQPSQKPGVCPAPDAYALSILPCADMCISDFDCPRHDKCCRGTCGRVCVSPFQQKPGTCPRRWLHPSECARIFQRACRNDAQCNGHFKCCDSGCGKTCVDPFVGPGPFPGPFERPGFCPAPYGYRNRGRCGDLCNRDNDCPPPLKCCRTGCGRACLKPRRFEEKRGACPRPRGFRPCVNRCYNDGDCPGFHKCCSNGCGRECMRPRRY